MTTLMRLTALLLLCFVAPAVADEARPQRLLMLLSGDSRLYYDAVDGFEDRLNETGTRFETRVVSNIDDIDPATIYSNADYVIAVGSKASRFIVDTPPPVPGLSILVPRQAYQAIMTGSQALPTQQRDLSVVYLDQPVSRLMALTKIVTAGRGSKVGVLFGPTSASLHDKYLDASVSQSLKLMIDTRDTEKASLDAIENLVKRTDAYLAVYDRKALNRKTAKWLLYLANVHKKPVVAYSKSYVDAGALAAVYTSPYEAGGNAANWLLENRRNGNTSRWQRYPEPFTVSINRKIARKLDIVLDEPEQLAEQVRRLEVRHD